MPFVCSSACPITVITCFGETRYYVTRLTLVEEVPIAPGVVAPAPSVPTGSPGASGESGSDPRPSPVAPLPAAPVQDGPRAPRP